MNWQSWSDFFSMGGDGLFVWLCVGITLLLIAGESLHMRKLWRKQQGTKPCGPIKNG